MDHEYTPEKPLVIYAESTDDLMGRLAEIDQLFENFGGVKVWHNLEIGGRQSIWITAPPNMQTPHWRAGEPTIITGKDCIVIKSPQAPTYVTRTFMDLELFKLAADLAGITAAIGVWVADLRERSQRVEGPVEFKEVGFDDFSEYMADLAADGDFGATAIAVVLHHSREVYVGNGYYAGTEEYEAKLPVTAVVEGDNLHIPADLKTPLTSWLVRIDTSTMTADLVDRPVEPDIVHGWRNEAVGIFLDSEPVDTDGWEEAVEVGGEVMSSADYEDFSTYEKPDDQFVWEECERLLSQILAVRLRRAFCLEETQSARDIDPNAKPVWRVVNKYGEEL